MTAAAATDELKTVRDLVRWGASRFAEAGLFFGHGTNNALDEAFFLVLHALHLPHDLPTVYLEAAVTADERTTVVNLLRTRVITRKPAAYLIGEMQFAGLPYFVDERVLVPRSPIGELIQQDFAPWLTEPPTRVLDLCTGSGCIGIACAVQFPDAAVDLSDISAGALAVARRNVERHQQAHGLQGRVRVIESDGFNALADERYDLIVSNPPYVGTPEWQALAAEYHHEPRLGLESGADGMELVARILREAPDHLTPEGLLICEVGYSQPAFEARWPRLPVVWVDFAHGGEGVFVISREALAAAARNGDL